MENVKLQENTVPTPGPPLTIFTAARLTDLLSRLLTATIFLLIVMPKISGLIKFVRAAGVKNVEGGRWSFYVAIGAQTSVIIFLSLMVVLFLIRLPPVKKAKGLFPRVTAIVGTFLMSIITIFPRADLGLWVTVVATLLVLLGSVLSTFVLARLGRSFSVMAEARRLVTSGPYALVRHPLYLTEEIAMLGLALQFFSLFTLPIFIIHLLVQIQRMKNEEAVLRQVYPEYPAYQARTARLIPKLY
jgi:protein-S-isoprenylcysteine O-methyltransferase Ste14